MMAAGCTPQVPACACCPPAWCPVAVTKHGGACNLRRGYDATLLPAGLFVLGDGVVALNPVRGFVFAPCSRCDAPQLGRAAPARRCWQPFPGTVLLTLLAAAPAVPALHSEPRSMPRA